MIKELQHRLTLLYTLTTGIIMTFVVIALSIISRFYLINQIDENFQNYIMNISTKLQTDAFFNISWIATMEADNQLIIHIEENGKPLLYQGSWNPPSSRDYLIKQAKQQAKDLNTDISVRPLVSASISPVFTMNGTKKDQYKCIAVSYPVSTGYKSMILIYYISPAMKTLNIQQYLFIAADIIGISALYFAASKFVKKAVKPLQDSNQKQQEFVAAASHELRSPLMAIQSSAEAIETVPEKTAQFTANIKRECKRMTHLVNDMLTLASIDADIWSITFETLDPNTLLIDLYELYEPVCLNQQIKLELKLQGDLLPDIKGDRERLFQLLTILIDNAISYHTDKKPITLEAFVLKTNLYIKVIDHGPGIPDEKKELIFDRFYRADNSRKDKAHFGLGLCIAKELASLHKASIQVTDTIHGGSTFTLKLPFQIKD